MCDLAAPLTSTTARLVAPREVPSSTTYDSTMPVAGSQKNRTAPAGTSNVDHPRKPVTLGGPGHTVQSGGIWLRSSICANTFDSASAWPHELRR